MIAINRPADSVDGIHGRVKTGCEGYLNNPEIPVDGIHGRVKTTNVEQRDEGGVALEGEHGRISMSFFVALNTPYYSYLVESSTQ